MRFIWATRGRAWGFRFLRDGGFSDPLPVYEVAFAALDPSDDGCASADGRIALRFADPLQRRDGAGRVIPHEFVLLDADPRAIRSVADGMHAVWPIVSAEYATLWDGPPPR